jgi:ABC-type molybdate transport system permease subunit
MSANNSQLGSMALASALAFSTLVVVIASSVFSFQFLKLKQQEALSQAVDHCMEQSEFTVTATNSAATTKVPVEETYLKCLELKKLK